VDGIDNSGVYVMECQGRYKIGVSSCVSKRLENLNTASPFKVELVAVFSTSTPYPLEKHLHQCFSAQNVKGEWFTLGLKDLEQLEQAVHTFAFPEQLSLGLQGEYINAKTEVELDVENLEEFWICPLCNFLTHQPGICDRCREEGRETVVHHTVQFARNAQSAARQL